MRPFPLVGISFIVGFQPFEMFISVGDTEMYVDVCRKHPFNHYLHQF